MASNLSMAVLVATSKVVAVAASLTMVLYVVICTPTLQFKECNSKTADTATDTAIRACQSRQFARQLELDNHGNLNTMDTGIAIHT